MLTRVKILSENEFDLEIRNAKPTDSIIVEKIVGLGPPDVDLFMGDYARDGGSYGGRRVPPRTVIFTLKINPNYKLDESVSGLRKLLTKAFIDPFTSSDGVNIILFDDEHPDRFIQGHTEKFESDIFSDDTTVQITMRCPNPYIQDVAASEFSPSGPTYPFEYNGSAEAGMVIKAALTIASPVLAFGLNNEESKLVLEYPFQSDDIVIVDTRRGSRRIQLVRTVDLVTTYTDILHAKTPDSSWLELHSPENILEVHGEEEDDIVANLTDISFNALYWGI